MNKEIDRNIKMIDRLTIDDQKLKLTKKIAKKFGSLDLTDNKKVKKGFKKKLEKETNKRIRKTTEKKIYRKKGYAK